MKEARSFRVCGYVQGVGYRYFTMQVAIRLGLRGWVRNRPDGEVEAVAEGESEVLDVFRAELERGPRMSEVSEVIQETVPETGRYSSFEIRG